MTRVDTLNGATVLLTRPDAYTDFLSDNIRRLGGRPIALPTIEVRMTTEGLDRESFIDHDVAVFISRNAVSAVADFLKESGLDWPTSLKCVAVGNKTAQAIRDAFGVSDVIAPVEEYGAKALMEMESMKCLNGKRVIFFDGGGARSVAMVLMLEERGCARATHAVVYERMQSRCDTSELIRILDSRQLDFVVLTSVEGAANLIAMLDNEHVEILKNSCMIVYSKRIETYLMEQGFDSTVVARSASDHAVLESIVEKHKDRLLRITDAAKAAL